MSALVSTQVTAADVAALLVDIPLGARLDFVCQTYASLGQDGVAYVKQCLAKKGTAAEKASAIMAGAHHFARRCDCEKDDDNPGLGAGPGPGRTYGVDMPLPWGANTPVTLPVEALANDFANAIQPRVDQALQAATASIRQAVEEGVSKPIQEGLASGNLVVQNATSKVNWWGFGVAALVGAALGLAGAKALERRRREQR